MNVYPGTKVIGYVVLFRQCNCVYSTVSVLYCTRRKWLQVVNDSVCPQRPNMFAYHNWGYTKLSLWQDMSVSFDRINWPVFALKGNIYSGCVCLAGQTNWGRVRAQVPSMCQGRSKKGCLQNIDIHSRWRHTMLTSKGRFMDTALLLGNRCAS